MIFGAKTIYFAIEVYHVQKVYWVYIGFLIEKINNAAIWVDGIKWYSLVMFHINIQQMLNIDQK